MEFALLEHLPVFVVMVPAFVRQQLIKNWAKNTKKVTFKFLSKRKGKLRAEEWLTNLFFHHDAAALHLMKCSILRSQLILRWLTILCDHLTLLWWRWCLLLPHLCRLNRSAIRWTCGNLWHSQLWRNFVPGRHIHRIHIHRVSIRILGNIHVWWTLLWWWHHLTHLIRMTVIDIKNESHTNFKHVHRKQWIAFRATFRWLTPIVHAVLYVWPVPVTLPPLYFGVVEFLLAQAFVDPVDLVHVVVALNYEQISD